MSKRIGTFFTESAVVVKMALLGRRVKAFFTEGALGLKMSTAIFLLWFLSYYAFRGFDQSVYGGIFPYILLGIHSLLAVPVTIVLGSNMGLSGDDLESLGAIKEISIRKAAAICFFFELIGIISLLAIIFVSHLSFPMESLTEQRAIIQFLCFIAVSVIFLGVLYMVFGLLYLKELLVKYQKIS